MCGIIGYIGKETEINLIEGLEKLEYRGYDSAGLCVLRNGDFYVEKRVGSVDKLKEKTKFSEDFGVGIAHTRWATHGKISVTNAHPHFSSNGDIAIVHNGIIENFEGLKEGLEKKGVYFYSETDSEVVAKLMSEKMSLEELQSLCKKLKGTYALAIISKRENCIYFAKNKSPLYVSIGKDCAMIASDPCCFAGKSECFYSLEDGEIGKLSLNGVEFANMHGKTLSKKSKILDIDCISNNKEKYQHFMLKEIYQSGEVIENILAKYSKDKTLLKKIKNMDFDRVYLVGCGTAFHAGLLGQRYFKENLEKDVYCERASEFVYQNNIINKKSLCIFISQSGETIDTITALDYAKKKGAYIVSITNVPYSTIATKSSINLPIFAGQEVAVASTKAYIGQCLVLFVLAQVLVGKGFVKPLKKFKNDINFGDDDKLKVLAKKIASKDKVVFIGRGYDFITCLESSLKMKEISYINSVAEPSGELKHGPIALVEDGTIVISISTDEELFYKTLNNAYETKSRGGRLALFTSVDLDSKIKESFDFVFKINKTEKKLLPLQSIILLQKLAYFVALEKGVNPDKPRNLAKSVTVE